MPNKIFMLCFIALLASCSQTTTPEPHVSAPLPPVVIEEPPPTPPRPVFKHQTTHASSNLEDALADAQRSLRIARDRNIARD